MYGPYGQDSCHMNSYVDFGYRISRFHYSNIDAATPQHSKANHFTCGSNSFDKLVVEITNNSDQKTEIMVSGLW